MPKFSKSSMEKISSCDTDLQVLFNRIIQIFDCQILCGYRNQEQQDAAFRDGLSKLKWPNSKHNSDPSMAVDVVPYPVDFKNTKRFYWFGGFVVGVAEQLFSEGKMKYHVRYGGDWDSDRQIDDENFRDLVHFELVK